eukprot:11105270-Alexandrium_andersonii.AAC.1
MSASLVGSEMCIRDSTCTSCTHVMLRDVSLVIGCGLDVVPGCETPRGPVSYTHLTLPTICSV